MEQQLKDVYIVLTHNGTAFSGLIKWFTRADLNHASIAFDPELREVYSFGRRNVHNPFIAGLVRENFTDSFYSTTECAVYRLQVNEREYAAMHNHVCLMMLDQKRYKYHLLGLLGVLFHIEINRRDAYFCSQFVASVLEEMNLKPVQKRPCFVTPEDFALSLRAHNVYKGKLICYLRRMGRYPVAAPVAAAPEATATGEQAAVGSYRYTRPIRRVWKLLHGKSGSNRLSV